MKAPRAAPPPPKDVVTGPFDDPAGLPARVAALRAKILEACAKRDIEALAVPIQWAETPPVFARGPERPRNFAEIVDFLKRRSFDRNGAEMVAILRATFEAPYARVRRGAFESYVFPALAVVAPQESAGGATGEARAALWRFVRFADLRADQEERPLVHRAVIGADGTWHSFLAEPV